MAMAAAISGRKLREQAAEGTPAPELAVEFGLRALQVLESQHDNGEMHDDEDAVEVIAGLWWEPGDLDSEPWRDEVLSALTEDDPKPCRRGELRAIVELVHEIATGHTIYQTKAGEALGAAPDLLRLDPACPFPVVELLTWLIAAVPTSDSPDEPPVAAIVEARFTLALSSSTERAERRLPLQAAGAAVALGDTRLVPGRAGVSLPPEPRWVR